MPFVAPNQQCLLTGGKTAKYVYTFLQRVSIACYAERCISYDRFCLTVCHPLISCQNDSSYDHAVFTKRIAP